VPTRWDQYASKRRKARRAAARADVNSGGASVGRSTGARLWSRIVSCREAGSPASRLYAIDDRRASDAERRHGWSRGRSSEGRKPRDGCGVKQSHEAPEGSNR